MLSTSRSQVRELDGFSVGGLANVFLTSPFLEVFILGGLDLFVRPAPIRLFSQSGGVIQSALVLRAVCLEIDRFRRP